VNEYKNSARNGLLQVPKLEVNAWEDKLQGEALDTLIKMTTILVIEEYVRDQK
jgi:hypothetical protein